jgi:hypothetical protein
MKSYRRWFQLFVLVTIVWFSSMGCVTKAVWKDKRISTQYSESIIAFYSNFKSKEVAFIGEKYHYVFNQKTSDFMQLLEEKERLNLQQENLQINASVGIKDENVIQTDIMVHFDVEKLNEVQKKWLLSHKYHYLKSHSLPSSEKKTPRFIKYYTILGERYLIKKEVNEKASKLKRAIPLQIIEYKREKGNVIKKIALTPLSITADAVGGAVLLVGAMIFVPVNFIGSMFK